MPHSTPADIRNERHIPDTNPDCVCDACGHTESWEDAKQSWSYSNDPDEPFLCPQCANERFRQEMRELQNHDLTDFQGVESDG